MTRWVIHSEATIRVKVRQVIEIDSLNPIAVKNAWYAGTGYKVLQQSVDMLDDPDMSEAAIVGGPQPAGEAAAE